MKIEFLYFDDCPSYQTAEKLLREVLAEENQSAEIEKIRIETKADALRWSFVGSPTIRLNGIDPFMEDEIDYGLECRVFYTSDGLRGWPTKEMLRTALRDLAE